MSDEFPKELIERCAKAVRRRQMERNSMGQAFDPDVQPTEGELDNAAAVLRESGHAELVAALTDAYSVLCAVFETSPNEAIRMLAEASRKLAADALKKPGAL